jgi:hypothetical protein
MVLIPNKGDTIKIFGTDPSIAIPEKSVAEL